MALAAFGALTLVAVLIALVRLRRERDFWNLVQLLAKDQYRTATPHEIDALLGFAAQRGQRDVALVALAQVRRLHGRDVKHGHMWWIASKLRGEIAPDAIPPACTPLDGLENTIVTDRAATSTDRS